MLFELHDIILHRMMLRSHKWYRNAVKKLCQSGYSVSRFDQWRMNRLYDIYVICKKMYNGHVRRPKGAHMQFCVVMDEVFSRTSMLKQLFPTVRIQVGVKHEAI
jgi:hypothetical protein